MITVIKITAICLAFLWAYALIAGLIREIIHKGFQSRADKLEYRHDCDNACNWLSVVWPIAGILIFVGWSVVGCYRTTEKIMDSVEKRREKYVKQGKE